jgi:hypothetical protein
MQEGGPLARLLARFEGLHRQFTSPGAQRALTCELDGGSLVKTPWWGDPTLASCLVSGASAAASRPVLHTLWLGCSHGSAGVCRRQQVMDGCEVEEALGGWQLDLWPGTTRSELEWCFCDPVMDRPVLRLAMNFRAKAKRCVRPPGRKMATPAVAATPANSRKTMRGRLRDPASL